MTPKAERTLRRFRWPFLLVWLVVVMVATLWFSEPYVDEIVTSMRPDEPIPAQILAPPAAPPKDNVLDLEWLYVQGNNVLLHPVVSGKCAIGSAVAQYHKGDMVLVVARMGDWIEIESENQTQLHTHGCIHNSLLGPDNPHDPQS